MARVMKPLLRVAVVVAAGGSGHSAPKVPACSGDAGPLPCPATPGRRSPRLGDDDAVLAIHARVDVE